MRCVRPDRPIDPLVLSVLRAFASACAESSPAHFVVGATARDILLVGVFGLPPARATRDLDIAIAVLDWAQFEAIRGRLVGTGRFEVGRGPLHRLYYRGQSEASAFPVDLLPFRGVEQAPHRVAWPPDMEVVMNVAGYEEALAAAEEVELEPGLAMRIASLPGLALLKLFAWADAAGHAGKHAQDLAVLLSTYADAGNQDRLYGDAAECLEAVDYDLALAAARLLGQDVRRMVAPETQREAETLLRDPRALDRLAVDMTRGLGRLGDPDEKARRFLDQFVAGVLETGLGVQVVGGSNPLAPTNQNT